MLWAASVARIIYPFTC